MPRISVLILSSILFGACSSERLPVADSVWTNGSIYTVDEAQPWVEAVAIKDGKFVAVGADSEIAEFIGEGTERVDLNGRMAMPGIVDTHVHATEAGRMATTCLAPGTWDRPSMEDFARAIRECNERFPEREVVYLYSFGPSTVEQDSFNKYFLDDVVPDKPVVLGDPLHYTMWLNSMALDLVGITRDSEPQNGGEIVKDDLGEPTGVLLGEEGLLASLELRQWRQASIESAVEGLNWTFEELAKHGVTSIMDAIVPVQALPLWKAALDAHPAPPRINLCLWVGRDSENVPAAVDLRAAFDASGLPDDVKVCAKIYTDGIMENGTSGLIEPYANFEHNGQMNFEPAQLHDIVADLDAYGIQAKAHSIGDRTTRELLNAYGKVIEKRGDNSLRHHIAHITAVHPDDIPRFAKLGIPAEHISALQAMIPYVELTYYPALGHERFHEEITPVAALVDSGAVVAANSDWPPAILAPFLGIQMLVTRQDPYDAARDVAGPQNRIDLESSIKIHTANGAYLLHREEQTGSIEVGKEADMIVLDRNLFEVPIDNVRHTKVLTTLIGGEVAWQSPEFDLQ